MPKSSRNTVVCAKSDIYQNVTKLYLHMIELSFGKSTNTSVTAISPRCPLENSLSHCCLLLSCFYEDSELIGKNLSAKNRKERLDPEYLTAYWVSIYTTTIHCIPSIDFVLPRNT